MHAGLQPVELRGVLREQRLRRRPRADCVRQRRGDVCRLHGDGRHVRLRRRVGWGVSVDGVVFVDDVSGRLLRCERHLPGRNARGGLRKRWRFLPDVRRGLALRGSNLLHTVHSRIVPLRLLRRDFIPVYLPAG
jgi:hypothetical protein